MKQTPALADCAAPLRSWRPRSRSRPLSAPTARAEAQLVAVIVNGDPITNFDIEQRTKLDPALDPQDPAAQGGDRRADRREAEDPAAASATASTASTRTSRTPSPTWRGACGPRRKQFTEQLAQVRRPARDAQVAHQGRNDLEPDHPRPLPEQLPVQRQGHPGEARDAASPRRRGNRRLRLHAAPDPVRGAARIAAGAWSRRAARKPRRCAARFQSCEQGIALARGLRDVAVRAPVVKSSADLPPALREILDKTELGRLTAPEVDRSRASRSTRCAARSSPSADNAPAKREVRDEMFTEQFETPLQALPQGTAQPSHDRIPVGPRRCRDRWR